MLSGKSILFLFFFSVCSQLVAQTVAMPPPASLILSPEGQERYRDVAKELRCPTCTGLSVLDSDAPFSLQIQGVLKEQVAAGKSRQEILDYFTQRYGPWILRAPPAKGFNALAWIFPILLMVFGPLLIWLLFWRRPSLTSARDVRSIESIKDEMFAAIEARRVAFKSAKGSL